MLVQSRRLAEDGSESWTTPGTESTSALGAGGSCWYFGTRELSSAPPAGTEYSICAALSCVTPPARRSRAPAASSGTMPRLNVLPAIASRVLPTGSVIVVMSPARTSSAIQSEWSTVSPRSITDLLSGAKATVSYSVRSGGGESLRYEA